MDKRTKKSSDLDLFNRYGEKIYLHYCYDDNGERVYSLEGNLDYARFIYRDNSMTIIDVIDPSGGPYMGVGQFFIMNDTYVLEKIIETQSGNEYLQNTSSGRILMYFKPAEPKL